MKKPANPLSIILVLLLLTATSVGWAATKIMPVSEVKPGMKGYGLTVFSGTKPEKFQVEVVSVVPNFLLRQNIILIKCSHPVTDKAGVIGGMSGSPIFIDGKLIGALAYGWKFSSEPLAGVTPIENMYDVLKRKVRKPKNTSLGKVAQFLNPFKKDTRVSTQRWIPLTDNAPKKESSSFYSQFANNESSQIIPARTPLSLSGFSGHAFEMLGDSLGKFGIEPMQGGGSGSTAKDPGKFVDGGAIGVQLIRGDMSATGIGTVTTTKDGNVLAFGHPMMNMGEGYLPVTTATIHTVVASLARSNKLGSPLGVIGSLIQDRQACIVARTDTTTSMIPVQFKIVDKRSGISDTYHVEVASHQLLTARLIHSALVGIVQNAASDAADVSAEITGVLKVKNKPPITLNDAGVSRAGLLPLVSYFRPSSIVGAILANPFEDVEIESLSFDVNLRYGLEYARIAGAYLTAQTPSPGDLINLHVRLVEYGGQEKIQTIPIRIPTTAENSKIQITVGGGDNILPPMPDPQNLDDILKNVQRYYPPRSIVVELGMPGSSLSLRGHILEDLPNSAALALKPVVGHDQVEPFKTKIEKVIPTNNLISGKHTITISVGSRRNK